MSAGTIPQAAFDRIDSVMKRALAGLSAEQLRTQPAGPDSNPIGWMAWHLSRVHDTNFSNLLGQGQAWVTEGWHERFGLPAALGSGGGDSLDDVRAFDPIAAATTLGYWEAAHAPSRPFLAALTDARPNTPPPPPQGPPTPTRLPPVGRALPLPPRFPSPASGWNPRFRGALHSCSPPDSSAV